MEARFSASVQTSPGVHPASCTMGTGSFLGVKFGRCVTLNPYPLIVLWSRKSRAIPLLPLWAVRPAQSLSACTRVHLTPHTLLVPWSRKSRAIPLLPLWAVRPVQSLSACTGVHLTFFTDTNPTKYVTQCTYKRKYEAWSRNHCSRAKDKYYTF